MLLNHSTGIPLYQQLKNQIITAINHHDLKPGQQIPTETELSEQYHVSRITVRRAIQELVEDGYLYKRQGKGTFVQERKLKRKLTHLMSFSDACRNNDMVPSTILLEKKKIILHDDDAKAMSLPAHSHGIMIRRLRLADQIPITLECNIFPYEPFSALMEEPMDGSLYELLRQKYQIAASVTANSYLDVNRADPEMAKLLKINIGDPVFYLYGQIYRSDKTLIHIAKHYICCERYRFCLDDYL